MSNAIRKQYESMGVDNYYLEKGNEYLNPHSNDAISCLHSLWNPDWSSVIDFACGDGLITKELISMGVSDIFGCDKFMYHRYMKETGKHCYPFSFEEISSFNKTLPKADVAIISYAIDLVPESYLSGLLFALSQFVPNLLIIRPNNHTIIHFMWEEKNHIRFGKSRCKLYSNKEKCTSLL